MPKRKNSDDSDDDSDYVPEEEDYRPHRRKRKKPDRYTPTVLSSSSDSEDEELQVSRSLVELFEAFDKTTNEAATSSGLSTLNLLPSSERPRRSIFTPEQQQRIQDEEAKLAALRGPTSKVSRENILLSNLPTEGKAAAMAKWSSMVTMRDGTGECNKLRRWLEGVMKLPFGVEAPPPVIVPATATSEQQVRLVSDYLADARRTMDAAIYGMHDIKTEILQLVVQNITNPGSIGQVVVLEGAPGTGKTSLARECLAAVLGRPCVACSLGGATDASFFEGHGFTYEGSTYGKLASMLMEAQCSNPVVYFDEAEKISTSPRGEEIASLLLHLLDPSQNSAFQDRYFAEVPLDFSKVLFVCSVNDIGQLHPVLRDRMKVLKVPGYTTEDKKTIGAEYLLPRLVREVLGAAADPHAVRLADDAMEDVIRRSYRDKGVRMLQQDLRTLLLKLNTLRFAAEGTLPYAIRGGKRVQLPVVLSRSDVRVLLNTGPGRKCSFAALTDEEQRTVEDEDRALDRSATARSAAGDLRDRLLLLPVERPAKQFLLARLKAMLDLPEGTSERAKTQEWFDALLALPWSREAAAAPLASKADKKAAIKHACQVLDEAVFGLREEKVVLLDFVAQHVLRRGGHTRAAPILCVVGPAGVGKTCVLKAVARALQTPYHTINVHGAKDGALLEGHSFTYVGSKPGKVVRLLQRTGTRRPVCCFEGVDGVADVSVLAAVRKAIDRERPFEDRYLAGVPLDVSNVVWAMTATSEADIDPALRDRVQVLHLHGYARAEKRQIAAKYLLPALETPSFALAPEAWRRLLDRHASDRGLRGLDQDLQALQRAWSRRALTTAEEAAPTPVTAAQVQEWLPKPLPHAAQTMYM